MKIMMVNGFLGSGKTTFLRRLINFFQNQRIAVIVNEYGKESFDAHLYESLEIMIEEINNGSIFCSCKSDQFLNRLIDISSQGIEQVFVESSGLSDPYSIGDILALFEKMTNQKLQEVKTITLVDGSTIYKVIDTLRLVRRQIEVSDILILNKIDLLTEVEKNDVKKLLGKINPFARLIETTYGKVQLEVLDYVRINQLDLPKEKLIKNMVLDTVTVYFENVTLEQLNLLLAQLNNRVYRIKGYVSKTYIVNTQFNQDIEVRPYVSPYSYLVFLFNKKLITEDNILEVIASLNIKKKELE
jgi:G3E family GTPase